MRIQVKEKLTFFSIIAAFGICGLVACNGDDSTAGKGMSADSTAKTASTADSTVKDTTAMAAKPAKKKRKASIVFPSNSTDKIVKGKDGVYNRAEPMPQYPGGQDALSAYINDHFDDGQPAIDDNTTGTVRISFVVDENGKVTDVRSMGDKKTTNGLADQAVKVIKDMPTWTPGKMKEKNVKTRLELPITFEAGF